MTAPGLIQENIALLNAFIIIALFFGERIATCNLYLAGQRKRRVCRSWGLVQLSRRDLIADRALRATGAPWNELLERMNAMRVRDTDWRRGRTALHVYHADDDVLQVAQQAYVLFSQEKCSRAGSVPKYSTHGLPRPWLAVCAARATRRSG